MIDSLQPLQLNSEKLHRSILYKIQSSSSGTNYLPYFIVLGGSPDPWMLMCFVSQHRLQKFEIVFGIHFSREIGLSIPLCRVEILKKCLQSVWQGLLYGIINCGRARSQDNVQVTILQVICDLELHFHYSQMRSLIMSDSENLIILFESMDLRCQEHTHC